MALTTAQSDWQAFFIYLHTHTKSILNISLQGNTFDLFGITVFC